MSDSSPYPMNRRVFLTAGAAAGASLLLPSAALAAAWEKISSDKGIDVFKMQVPGSPLFAFRGTAVVDAPIGKVMWVLADSAHRTEWVDRLKKSVVLEKKNDWEFVLYQHFGSPPIISDRDFVFKAKAYSTSADAAALDIVSTTHPKAPKTEGVRGHLSQSSYILKKVGENKTHVDVSVHLDPKGSIPNWLVNMVQKSWPKNTLSGLREQVKKPYVKSMGMPPMR